MEKEFFDDDCLDCVYGWHAPARLSMDAYDDEDEEYGCNLDYECPYLTDENEEL
jgi:hypothetical protein